MVKEGKYYTAANSSLVIFVHRIFYSNDVFLKAKISLFTKSGILMESRKSYRLQRKSISHWRES